MTHPATPAPAFHARRIAIAAATTLALIFPAAAQTATDAAPAATAAALHGLWLTTDYPELTGHAGSATTVRLQLANRGFPQALALNSALARGLNTYDGKVTHEGVATAFNLPWMPVEEVIRS